MIYDYRYQYHVEPEAILDMLDTDEAFECSENQSWEAEAQEIANLGNTHLSWRGRYDFYLKVLDWLQRPFEPVFSFEMELEEDIVLEEPDWTE